AVEREDVPGVECSREAAVVGAEVPRELRGPGAAHKPLLAIGVFVAVRRRPAVARPLRAPALRREPRDELLQPAHVGLDQLLLETRLLELRADVALPVGVPRLEAVVQDDVRQHPAAEARQERAGLRRLDALEAPAQERLRRDAAVSLQHQRIEEERAELPVAGPRLA